MKIRLLLVLLIGGTALFLAACINLGSGRSPGTKFFLLETGLAASDTQPTVDLPDGFAIGVGPVKMPQYLDLPMLVTRTGPHEMQTAEFHQWAEPLADNISRVMSADLLTLTGAAHTFSFPWRSAIKVHVQVVVSVIQFDATLDGTVTLKAQWSLFKGKGKQVLLTRRSDISRQAGGSGYPERVAAMSLALGELTREIAGAIINADI